MPPWRTVDDSRPEGKPVSFTTMAGASSAALRCCTSKSGGTYSASITGVSGSTLTKRIVPSDAAAIINAVATAGLGRAGTVRGPAADVVGHGDPDGRAPGAVGRSCAAPGATL